MKQFLVTLITICLFTLYFIPPVMITKGGDGQWALFYIPVLVLSILWGVFINDNWRDL